MTTYTGSALYLAWKGTTLQADYRSFDPAEEIGAEDASAGSDTARTYKTTLKDGNASLTMRSISGTAGTALWATTMAVGGEGTLEWAPEGTGTGYKRAYVNAILTGRNEANAYAGITEWTFDWQYSGAVTYTVY